MKYSSLVTSNETDLFVEITLNSRGENHAMIGTFGMQQVLKTFLDAPYSKNNRLQKYI